MTYSGSPHSCGGKPNDDGRTLPKCDGCYDTAYEDGRKSGYEVGLDTLAKAFKTTVRRRFDPFQDDVALASEAFRNGRAVLELMQQTLRGLGEG